MGLRPTTAKLFGFKDDEVLVESLQGGVGQASGAVEDRTAKKDHIEPLDERAARKAVKERLLVEAAGVEVGIAKRCDDRWILQALVADDQLGLHGRVEIMFLDPTSDAFGEREVIERIIKLGDLTIDLEDFIDSSGIAGALGTDEAYVEGRDLSVLKPGVEEKVAAAYPKCCGLIRSGKSDLLHLVG